MTSWISSRLFTLLLVTFTLLSVLGQISTSIYTPYFTDLAALYNTSTALIEKSVALFLIAFSVSQLLSGIACDYVNKKQFLLIGAVIFILGSLLVALAHGESSFLFGRIVQGLGGGVGVSVTRALSRQLFDEQQLTIALSLTNVAFGVAPAIAPILGTVVGEYFGITAIFNLVLLLAVIALLLLFITTLSIENHLPQRSVNVFSDTLSLLKCLFVQIALLGVASGMLYGIVFSFVTIAPSIIIGQHAQSKALFSVYSLLATLCFVLGSVTNIKLLMITTLQKFKLSCLIILILSLATLVGAVIAGISDLRIVLTVSYLMFFFIGIAMPCSVSLMLGFSNTTAGLLAALVGFFHLSGAATGAYVVATVNMRPTMAFVIVTTGLSLGSVILCTFIRTTDKRSDGMV